MNNDYGGLLVLEKIFLPITAFCLLLALAPMPYDYYVLLRFLVGPVCLVAAYRASQNNLQVWLWTFLIGGIIFNPLIRVHLERPTWATLNCVLAVAIMVFLLKRERRHSS